MNNNPIKKPNKVRLFSDEWVEELRQKIVQIILDDQEEYIEYAVNNPGRPSREELIMIRGCITGFCVGLTYVLTTTSNHRALVCLIVAVAAHAISGALLAKIYPPTDQD